MQLGMIGLGRMGGDMVRRLMKGGHECVVYDRAPAAGQALAKEGATGAATHVLPVASRGEAEFQNRVLSAMRSEFGGHAEKKPS